MTVDIHIYKDDMTDMTLEDQNKFSDKLIDYLESKGMSLGGVMKIKEIKR